MPPLVATLALVAVVKIARLVLGEVGAGLQTAVVATAAAVTYAGLALEARQRGERVDGGIGARR